MDDEAIGYLGASELVAAYAAGSLSPTEVTAAILRRIEAVNPHQCLLPGRCGGRHGPGRRLRGALAPA